MRPNIVYRIVHVIARTFFTLYGQWEIIGYDRLPKTGPVIVLPNHISYLDPPIVGAAIKRECAFMARHDLWHNKLLAWFLPRLGAFPVHRGESDRAAIRSSLAALEQGLCLMLFPEGTRSRTGNLQPAEPGVTLIIQKSGAPVVPVALIGSNEMMVPGSSRIRRAKLRIIFGKPITFDRSSGRDEILLSIMRSIAALLTEHGVPMVAAEDRADEALGAATV